MTKNHMDSKDTPPLLQTKRPQTPSAREEKLARALKSNLQRRKQAQAGSTPKEA
jgi:hypothetical protein